METPNETIWYNDPGSLFTKLNFGSVVPTASMTFAEQLNAVLRFSIYYAAIMFAVKQSADSFVFPVVTAAITYIVFQHVRARPEAFGGGAPGEEDCTEPSADNPFMNVLADELGSERARACDPLDDHVRDSIDQNFRAGAFVDQDDIYGRNTGARQFYTNPVTTGVNDQKGYAEWLYGAVNCSGKQVRPPPRAMPLS